MQLMPFVVLIIYHLGMTSAGYQWSGQRVSVVGLVMIPRLQQTKDQQDLCLSLTLTLFALECVT